MKKMLIPILALLIFLTFSACSESDAPALGGSSNSYFELGFRSVLDTETGAIFTLGDHRSAFEDALGEGEPAGSIFVSVYSSYGDWTTFSYSSFDIIVTYFEDEAVEMMIRNLDRFEFAEITLTSFVDSFEEFTVSPNSTSVHNTKIFDENGATLPSGSNHYEYIVTVSTSNGHIHMITIQWSPPVHAAMEILRDSPPSDPE